MLASALHKVVTFAGGVLFERKFRLIKLEATLGERIDLRISGKLEELYQLKEKHAKAFLMLKVR